ncbi:SHOCT domain-containing protein [Clostridium sp. SHJSY1]|uniref:SHOCT domain-containing protein n=1 Tax=Clostridium sp. SHJSY1 TaxID=2942483 RepID=UPI0028756BAA|nr:SHOCT domain-containing protein [Clostridium sp. SHJSY1]MDS0526917.1 SHOCT domain-containing protein [Clostridium sp. SHJSY1]
MMRSYHMRMGFYGFYVLIFFLIVFSVLIYLLLRKKSTPSPFIIKLIDILKEKYASGIIDVDEYMERKSIIQDIKYTNSYIPLLLERYANCKIDTKELEKIKYDIENKNLDIGIIEKLVKGEIPYDKYKDDFHKNRLN